MPGNVDDFSNYFASGHLLAVLPISRLHVDWDAFSFPRGIHVIAPGDFDLDSLNVHDNKTFDTTLSEAQSGATGVDADLLSEHPLIVFPCRFNWHAFDSDSHKNHMRFIRTLSQYVDVTFLDVARFSLCRLGLVDTLPGRAGTIIPKPMFAAAVLYNPDERHARLIAGAAFTHSITVGLGLALESIDNDAFPMDGKTGKIASHGLALYRNTLEAYDHTSRFINAITLLEFLANPTEYEQFKDVKKIIVRYVTTDQLKYDQMLDWFVTLTGRKDNSTDEAIGYRTRIVYLGHQLEDCLDDKGISELYGELDRINHCVIRHMIVHSQLDWVDYLTEREKLGPFA